MRQVLINMAGAHVAIRLGARGPNHALVLFLNPNPTKIIHTPSL